jgi:biotin transport system substrate-specific component
MSHLTYADVLRPGGAVKARLYDLTLVVAGSLLIAASAQLAVWVGPVPITGQTFAVLLAGALLGSRRGTACILAYLAEGACGLGVFAGGAAGLAYMRGATLGYLVGFVPAAYVTGALAERGWDRRFRTTVAAMTIGTVVILGPGAVWLSILSGPRVGVMNGLLVFLPGDACKVLLAAAALPAGWKLLRRG